MIVVTAALIPGVAVATIPLYSPLALVEDATWLLPYRDITQNQTFERCKQRLAMDAGILLVRAPGWDQLDQISNERKVSMGRLLLPTME